MAEQSQVVNTLEEAVEQLVGAWNLVHEFPEGPRLLHRLFGSRIETGALPGKERTGGMSLATTVAGVARKIDAAELQLIPQEIRGVREEAARAERIAAGLG